MTDSSIGNMTNERAIKFKAEVLQLNAASVLELGTLRWEEDLPWHHKHWAPSAERFVMADIEDGLDVDIVSDAHDLKEFGDGEFDAVIATSVWEHLPRPWLASLAVARVLKPGGILYVETHQSFPLHGYPHDYFRFSAEALSLLFEDAGLTTEAGYSYPCQIVPPKEVTRWSAEAPCYLNVNLFGRKPV